MAMKILHIKWFRQVLLASIYILGVLGIVGSGGGGGGDLDCALDGFLDDCVDPPAPPPPFQGDAIGFNGTVNSISPALDGSDDVYVGGEFFIYKNSFTRGIARLNNDGSLDMGFVTGPGFSGVGVVNSVAPATDGSGDVYVGGRFTDYNGSAVNYIARLNLDGTLDAAFDSGIGFDSSVSIIAPATDGSGDVYVGGAFTSYNSTAVSSGLIRLNADGSLDAGFNVGSGWGEDSVALANDGSGDVYVTSVTAPRIARLNDDGSIDTGFDAGTSGFNHDVRSITVAIDGSGDIYVAGSFTEYNGMSTNGIARLNSNGSMDTGFITESGFVGRGAFITPATDGSGDIYTDSNVRGDIVRLNEDGSRDVDFARGGFSSSPSSAALASDGSNDVYVGGIFSSYKSTPAARMVRITSRGVIVR